MIVWLVSSTGALVRAASVSASTPTLRSCLGCAVHQFRTSASSALYTCCSEVIPVSLVAVEKLEKTEVLMEERKAGRSESELLETSREVVRARPSADF